jgi:hypothetical protein
VPVRTDGCYSRVRCRHLEPMLIYQIHFNTIPYTCIHIYISSLVSRLSSLTSHLSSLIYPLRILPTTCPAPWMPCRPGTTLYPTFNRFACPFMEWKSVIRPSVQTDRDTRHMLGLCTWSSSSSSEKPLAFSCVSLPNSTASPGDPNPISRTVGDIVSPRFRRLAHSSIRPTLCTWVRVVS